MTDRAETPEYQPSEIEPRWQERWHKEGLYRSDIDRRRPKHYALTMLPYPSGNLHIGHWYAMTPPDARARWMRMRGYNVLFPMGFDSFGLPAENAAIKNNVHPRTWTEANIEHMRGQLKSMGAMFDWRREARSSDPSFYRWTQWLFLKLLAGGLAYRRMAPVDWCPSCNTTLAREQVVGEDRICERCETPVVRKDLEQWFLRTTAYAEELLDTSKIDWPDRVLTLQRNWIGRSEGARVRFELDGVDAPHGPDGHLEVFTTRPDTLWGATFMVLAPEHPLVDALTTEDQRQAVTDYRTQAARQSDIQREAADREKTGVFTGGHAINPVNGERVPVWIADYVLMSYGTGAIMAVPAHDQRDFEFARKFDLPVRPVIVPEGEEAPEPSEMTEAVEAKGRMVDSGDLTGTPLDEAFDRVVARLEDSGAGERSINYRLRDWLVSRQRYWGCPIPIVYCETCGAVPVPDDQLPVDLPDDIEWRPTGESPLKLHPTWKHVDCPSCGGPGIRETDTFDTFVDSSWYHLRYLSPQYDQGPWDPDQYDYWMSVDSYTGGIEHATMHLIYTRFFHKALRDVGVTSGDEPMLELHNQGMVLGEDSEKMSKSRGNVISPDDLVERYGTDTVRAFLMFFARWEQGGPWNSSGIEGAARWLKRTWALLLDEGAGEDGPIAGTATPKTLKTLRRKVHQTLAQIGTDFERYQFNTVVSGLMELLNEMTSAAQAGTVGTPEWQEARSIYLRMMAPVAPHAAEEMWDRLGYREVEGSVHVQDWPQVDEEATREDEITLVVQVNGKVRDKLTVPADTDRARAERLALACPGAQKFIAGKAPKKVIVVPGRLVNIVV